MVRPVRHKSTHQVRQLPTEGMSPKDTSSPKISPELLSNFSSTLGELGKKLKENPSGKWMIGRVMKGDHKGEFTLRKKGFASFWARLTGNVDFKHLAEDQTNDGLKEVLDRFVSSTDQLDAPQRAGELNVAGRLLRGRFRQIGRRLISDEAKVKAHETYSNILDQVFSGDTTGISAADLQQISQSCVTDFTLAIPLHYDTAFYNDLAEKNNKPLNNPYDLQGLKYLNNLYQLLEKTKMT